MEYIREANMNISTGFTTEKLTDAIVTGEWFCAVALVYEKGVGLLFNLDGIKGIMPADQVMYSPANDEIKEAAVITRINKNVCFEVTDIKYDGNAPVAYLSRKNVQKKAFENYIYTLTPGDIIGCKVTHIDSFGVFCDVGCGITALLPIDFISVSRIGSPADRFETGQNILACIRSISPEGRIVLTHKELLGTWEENAAMFRQHTTVVGIVRSIEDYGIFIELAPNLAGLAEVCNGIDVGDVVEVYIKSILPEKMKVKLVIMSKIKDRPVSHDILYFTDSGHIDRWDYSSGNRRKNIFTVFE